TKIVNQRTDPIAPEGRWLEGTRRRAQVLHMPGCHTPDDLVVWVPDDKALLVGDIFGWGLIPLTRVLNEESAGLLVDTHNRLIELGAETVIPGHGPLCTSAELRRWLDYFHWLRGTIAAACAAGKTDAQIVEETAPPEDMATWWRFLLWKHADSVNKVLRAVRSGALSG
ncbi:hypothetical protein LCGC14_2490950, partial [marine sediment metagenome]